MKKALMPIVVGGVFLAGIFLGTRLSTPEKAATVAPAAMSTKQPELLAATATNAMPSPPTASGPSGVQSAQAPRNGGTKSAQPPGPGAAAIGGEPPAPPPPIAPEALAEGERIKAEIAAEGSDQGNGRVTTLVPGTFESPEERAAWEEKRKKRWEKRLQRENDIKLEEMRDRVGLQPGQEAALRGILADEFKERSRLVDTLTAREISRTSFDEAVKANVAKARQRLRNLLTPEQYTAYHDLAPREQVLRHETK